MTKFETEELSDFIGARESSIELALLPHGIDAEEGSDELAEWEHECAMARHCTDLAILAPEMAELGRKLVQAEEALANNTMERDDFQGFVESLADDWRPILSQIEGGEA